MSKSKNGNGHAGSGVFGSPDRVLVKRGLAEFRSGRPVIFSSNNGEKFLIALPVDGLDAARLHAFEHLCAPAKPKLVVTARRARALGIETAGSVALTLPRRRERRSRSIRSSPMRTPMRTVASRWPSERTRGRLDRTCKDRAPSSGAAGRRYRRAFERIDRAAACCRRRRCGDEIPPRGRSLARDRRRSQGPAAGWALDALRRVPRLRSAAARLR